MTREDLERALGMASRQTAETIVARARDTADADASKGVSGDVALRAFADVVEVMTAEAWPQEPETKQ